MRKLLIIVAVLASASVFGQQDPQFSQYMFNRLFPNPAVAGSKDAICITGIGRQQWTGLDGAPTTGLISGHAPVRLLKGGVGLSVFGDQIGPISYFGARAAYAYRRSLGPGTIAAGVALGMLNTGIDGSQWVALDDPTTDVTLNRGGDIAGTVFDMTFGLYYHTDKLYAGISTNHLIEGAVETNEGNYNVARHYYIMGGYSYDLTSDISLEPSTFIKTDGRSAQIDLNVSALYKQMLWGGLSFRPQDVIAPIIGFFYPLGPGVARIGYSYDIGLNQLRSFHSGSHEIMLNYCFKITPKPKVQRHRTVLFL